MKIEKKKSNILGCHLLGQLLVSSWAATESIFCKNQLEPSAILHIAVQVWRICRMGDSVDVLESCVRPLFWCWIAEPLFDNVGGMFWIIVMKKKKIRSTFHGYSRRKHCGLQDILR
eukprot:Pompholyxophrys_punicea_v1_NODE_1394_length_740_cov_11.252555.p1 type:complete len:116 gc:universal NODE_1394_length_740_cov_11.252555:464-117(-)